ncbi:DUF6119 family protein [Promicromonospora iranensis]|uniref:DUF6119 family protein n=1 Tax=Promicromonospora iranensis TaxID=1105144 RepID=UPI0023A99449|nr:DUF6119 family protein [Promicromonospora iranensis]
MTVSQGIAAPIYRIDVDAALEFLGDNTNLDDVPGGIITLYNKEKGEEVYRLEGRSTIDGCQLELYRNVKTRPNTSTWVHFFKGSGIELGEIKNEMQHLVCFVGEGGDLYAYTAGQGMVAFERFIDISFPIEVGRRVARPEVKGVRSSQITGANLASDVHFRDPRRISHVESLENVWTALSGQLLPAVVEEALIVSVFGRKSKIKVDVTASVRFGPKVKTPEKIVALIRWLSRKVDTDIPEDDGWSSLDAIKVLNPRKKKDLVARLKGELAARVFLRGECENIAVTHVDASIYDNATAYTVLQQGTVIYEGPDRPSLGDVVRNATIDGDVLANLTNISIASENLDYGAGFGTTGTLLSHLHGELRHGEKTYYLLAGRWYEVEASYIKQVTKDLISTLEEHEMDRSRIGMRPWQASQSEGEYNKRSVSDRLPFINGDRVLTDNVELFDTLVWDDESVYVVHVKRGFDVKIRDVRSQIINSAHIIENDLRAEAGTRLKAHYRRLVSNDRTTLDEVQFMNLFEKPRTYVLAYGSPVQVNANSIKRFGSSVARMEVVSLANQFRQIGGAAARLCVVWLPIESEGSLANDA